MQILVVGGAGFIGSHMVKMLIAEGHKPVVFDNLSTGHADAVMNAELIVGDLADAPLLDSLFTRFTFDGVMHFASCIQTSESIQRPDKYYRNNVAHTLNLLDAMVRHKVMRLIFSSSAAIYGNPQYSPIDETHPTQPINPYGKSKLMVEQILTDYENALGLQSISLRYFNAAGADPESMLGERHHPETHLIPLLLQHVLNPITPVSIFGKDYDTPDGTCIRDYIHITDLCQAHLLALEKLFQGTSYPCFNLGNGNGFSVQEVIATVENATGNKIKTVEAPRRAGDPARLIANSQLAQSILGWKPAYPKLSDIVLHAWNYSRKITSSKEPKSEANKIFHNLKTPKQLLSVVIPCYNEEEVIGETVKRLRAFCTEVDNLDVELIFVDDGSVDHTRELLKRFAKEDWRIKVISFARNFGHQIALTAGIDAAKGDAVVLIDADLQDPPEVIHQMINKWREGYDVVYGTRIERFGESTFKLLTAKYFYRFLSYISDISIPLDAGDFRLLSRKVANSLRAMPERDRFVRGMVSWVGFKQTALPYKRVARFAGVSKYPLKKMLRFAVDGVLSFSTRPLQISIGFGMVSAGFALIGICYALVIRLFTNIWVEGWTALIIAILFIGGVQLISIGVLGEYVGRIYNEIKRRPLYIVQEYVGFSEDDESTLYRSPTININK